MAQFDVHRNPGRHRDSIPFVVIVQSSIYDDYRRRVVVPLVNKSSLGTVANSMPQLGLLYILVAMPMNMLSGSNTPLESMPVWLQTVMQASPSTHFVAFAQAILYRGAGFSVVWPRFLAIIVMASVFLGFTLIRFRSVTARAS